MTRTAHRVTAGIATALLSAAGAMTSAHAAAAPPWEPDPASAGGLTFYDAAGHAITGGTITSAPFAAYVVGASTLRSGDTKATLYGYLPVSGKPAAEFSGEQLSSATSFPATGAPSGVSSSLPVVTGSSTDESLAALAADYPNNGTGAYAGIYQLRLVTSAPGESVSSTYDSADIRISGNTWSVVYSGGTVSGGGTGGGTATATHSGLKASSSKVKHGSAVKLTATETPAVRGKFAFFDGSKRLGTVTAKSGKAVYTTKTLKIGTHRLHAVFTPADTTKDKPSTSKVVSVKVTRT
ncbi:MAG TPA: Ig-like domain-containing protein [Mycobacteriales bacterium]|nr:Ig-like domain-containing protein [Mycobacteriales bacterium]